MSSPPSPRPWEERNNPVPYVPKAPPGQIVSALNKIKKLLRK